MAFEHPREAPTNTFVPGLTNARRKASSPVPLSTMQYQVYLSNFQVEAYSERDAFAKAQEAMVKSPRSLIWRVTKAKVYRRKRRGLLRRGLSWLI